MDNYNSVNIIDALDSSVEKLPRIRGRNITELPDLSRFVNVKMLNIHDTEITEIKNLPPNLKVLFCNNNRIEKMSLPSTLRSLFCMDNHIEEIIDLPEKLHLLKCEGNRISRLRLPSSLKMLVCDSNRIKEIPYLHEGLEQLSCCNNSLLDLGIVPSSLTYLNCCYNPLQFKNLGEWKTIGRFRKTFFKYKLCLFMKKCFYRFIKRRKFEINSEIIYSPNLGHYKSLLGEETLRSFKFD